jgi:2',3'-cyclic-nucleotide 2'-phosphodiesterase/3'-nucleotidase
MGILCGAAPAWAQDRVSLQVLSTTDLHMNLKDYDYYEDRPDPAVGLNRVAPLIRAARAANPNTLLLDNGDTIQGTPMGDWVARERGITPDRPHPAVAAMNLLGYDAAVLGNHEFNYGLDILRQTYASARFPVLAGNVFVVDGDQDPANDKTLYPAYTILEREVVDADGDRHRLRIGILGVLTPQIMVWDRDKLDGRVTTRDIVDTAASLVPAMRAAGADVVIALSHAGISPTLRQGGEEQASAYLTAVPGIDAVVTGHSHRVFPSAEFDGFPGADLTAGTINGVPLVMAGQFGSHLGVITLDLEKTPQGWRVAAGRSAVQAIQQRQDNRMVPMVEPDGELTALLEEAHRGTLAYVRRPVGRTTGPIHSFFAFIGDSPAVELVAEAQRAYIEKALVGTPHAGLPILSAAAPFKSGGRPGVGYYTDIPTGEIAIRNVADLYVYPNQLAAVRLNGAQVREWLEAASRALSVIDPTRAEAQPLVNRRVPSYNFDVIDGVTYAIDVTQPYRYGRDGLENPDARRIVDMRFQGQPIRDDQDFIVVTNNYRANGGGAFPGLDGSTVIYQSPDTVQQAIVDYIRAKGVVEPSTDGTFRIAPVPAGATGPVTITYDTSPAALPLLGSQPGLTHIGPGEDGFSLFQVDLTGSAP